MVRSLDTVLLSPNVKPNVKKKEMLLEMLLDYDGLPPGVPSFAGR